MQRLLTGLVMGLLATAAWSKFAPDWVDYGLMPDGSMHSWNQRTVQQEGDTLTVTSRLRYTTPQTIPGTTSNKYRPAKRSTRPIA